ncbi:MAG: O-methyltransferase [Phycisphaerae bacterium]
MIDALILAVIDEVDALRKTRDDHWQIPRAEGDLIYHIALSAAAKVVVEVGTSYGFSGLFWGAALKRTGGRLHTIDLSQKKFDASRANFARAGLADVITNHLGDAHEVLAKIPGPIDVAFIDADKPACRDYFETLWPKLRVGGSILTDNATTHRTELADFVRYLRSREDASSVEVAVGNGIEWTVKVK